MAQARTSTATYTVGICWMRSHAFLRRMSPPDRSRDTSPASVSSQVTGVKESRRPRPAPSPRAPGPRSPAPEGPTTTCTGCPCWSRLSVCGAGVLVGRRTDSLTLLGACAAVVEVAYVTYAIVFAPIGGGLQGRHLLPIFVVVPTLAWVVVAEHLGRSSWPGLVRRQAILVGVVMGWQLVSVLVNGRRYAVGVDGPIWFFSAARSGRFHGVGGRGSPPPLWGRSGSGT
jgi:hypothetical protein